MIFRVLVAASLGLTPNVPAYVHAGLQPQTDPRKPLTLAQVWTLDAIYADHLHGVSFKYPSSWRSVTQFGYVPPALTQSASVKPAAGFGYSEGPFPRDRIVGPYSATNLEGFGLVYSAVPAANRNACEATASSLSDRPKLQDVVVGGRSFAEYLTGGPAMSQFNSGKLYAAYVRPACYLFETDAAMSNSVQDLVPTLTSYQQSFIDKHLFSIMKTVRITPNKWR